jgi:hypothetical protein
MSVHAPPSAYNSHFWPMALKGQSLSVQHSRQMSGVLLEGHFLPARRSVICRVMVVVAQLEHCMGILLPSSHQRIHQFWSDCCDCRCSPTMLMMVPVDSL